MYRQLPDRQASECLGSMTPETQDIYLRLDHTRRRSGYRLGRIIARQQLLKRIAGGTVGRAVSGWMSSALVQVEASVLTFALVQKSTAA